MTRTFIETKEFTRKCRELDIDDESIRKLEIDIMRNPEKYPVIPGTGRLRKARISVENKGKSGGARVCFVDFVILETVYFITVYGKKDKDNLTKQECNKIKKAIDTLGKALGGTKDGK